LFKNPILSGAVSLAVAAWCAYDLWFAVEPSRGGVRVLDYFLMVMALAGVVGAFLISGKQKA
jgi:hypothetical protein